MTSRRRFIQRAALAAAGTLARRAFPHSMSRARPAAGAESRSEHPGALRRSACRFPRWRGRVGTHTDPTRHGEQAPHYRVAMRATSSKLHRDLPATALVVLRRVGSRRHVRYAQRRESAHRVGQRAAARNIFCPSITRCMARRKACPGSARRRAPARRQDAAGKRRLSGGLVRARPVAHLSLSQRAGRGAALVSRSCHGHQSAEHLRRIVRPSRHSRRSGRRLCICRAASTKSRWCFSIAICAATGN